MNQHIETFKYRLREQTFAMIFFSAMFSLIGYYVPRIYFQYFDKTVYFSFNNPLEVDNGVYKPCQKITMTINRTALITSPAVSIKSLYLVNDSGTVTRVNTLRTEINIYEDVPISKSTWSLPCDINPGLYYYKGLLTFQVRGIEKQAEFVTKRFNIEDREPVAPISPQSPVPTQ